ncbi:uncharacterized protein LOC114757818 [Neltuma alba]|uniref:uncharacterized protein LOC114755018 n=1 Tax=Neltuma alba TaxID=207710 RepID=UPI0010A560D0|nr:uncharacterized protein LOC114755018 [Prosopis alba]XP_028802753.1 uncharacterized protein LOC114757818 [Prosopis alba]
MASLTPGVLSKLLENAGNKNVRVTGEHRSALLQVIEIVPCFAGGDDPWQSRGYFLKVSDSKHSAYVSISDEDVDLIYSDKIQLGQFVYVTRLDLDSASPVPVLSGLKPVPNRRPCVGNPVDLNSSDSLTIGSNLDFRKPKKGSKNGVKKMVGVVKSKEGSPLKNNGLEMRRLSLDSARRAWDQSPGTPTSRFKSKSTSTSSNVIDKKASLKNDSPLKPPTPTISPLKNKNENFSPKLTSTPQPQSTRLSPCTGNVRGNLVKVPLNVKTQFDPSTTWDSLPPILCNLGKKVASHKNIAFLAAVRALEEASASDTVIQCMCVFTELCQSSQTLSAGSLVEKFLDLHLNLQRARMVLDPLLMLTPEKKPSEDVLCKAPSNKNAVTWVQAALQTNLSKFNLFRTQAKAESLNGEKCHYIVIENSRDEMNTENTSQSKQKPTTTVKRVPSSKRHLQVAKSKDAEKVDQGRESRLKEAASLAEKLLVASQEWFLKYLEDSLDSGFGLRSEEGRSEIACLLGQLKKVNHWLDALVGGGDKVDGRVENLRKSLYGFLLERVNSAIPSSK